jgi:hypothetical protein
MEAKIAYHTFHYELLLPAPHKYPAVSSRRQTILSILPVPSPHYQNLLSIPGTKKAAYQRQTIQPRNAMQKSAETERKTVKLPPLSGVTHLLSAPEESKTPHLPVQIQYAIASSKEPL